MNANHQMPPLGSWLVWLLGVSLFGFVIVLALNSAEERAFIIQAEHARPQYLLIALLLQSMTYLAQSQIWRMVSVRAKETIDAVTAYKLALAKLFVDQSLPSAGVSGNTTVAALLRKLGMSRPVIMAGVVINLLSYYIAYGTSLTIADVILVIDGQANGLIIITSTLFVVLVLLVALLIWCGSAGRPDRQQPHWICRIRLLRKALRLLAEADVKLAHSRSLMLKATLLQMTIILLDTLTLGFLIHAVGSSVAPPDIFASFMLSSLLRTISIVPGGLGVFEAASIVSLQAIGVPVAAALSATLLFRGMSFWLPMVPGFLCSRSLLKMPVIRMPRLHRECYWSIPQEELLRRLNSGLRGLPTDEARKRIGIYGPNTFKTHEQLSRLGVLWNQLRSPLLLLLVFAAAISAITGEWVDALIITLILAASVGIAYAREYHAQKSMERLRDRLQILADVFRNGEMLRSPAAELVPGDVFLLSAGKMVPADAVILNANHFFANEAVLTGESYPVEKSAELVAENAGLSARNNCVFMGTQVHSGSALCVTVATGRFTQLGAIAHRLSLKPPATEFDRGIRHFGYMLATGVLVMVILVFFINVLFGREPIQTLLFSVALAVGLSPELMPVILSVNLSRGAQMMAQKGVLVKRLNAIENLGSMDILCTDKTGTLTEGVVRLDTACDWQGEASDKVLRLAVINAALQGGLQNPLDEAILQALPQHFEKPEKIAEIPYDFVRKRLSVAIRDGDGICLITKGAFESILDISSHMQDGAPLNADSRAHLVARYAEWTGRGTRVLGMASRRLNKNVTISREAESEMVFEGFLLFMDRPKQGVAEALQDLLALGVSVKLITGDSKLVALHVANAVGMRADRVLTGKQLDEMHGSALLHAAEDTDLFVEVDPNQKERIILSLKKMHHVVGFLGDGINDAPAMHAADTSISVDQAVDVAKEAADFVLMERHLDTIRRGIEEGRKTFANTLKYVLTTTSANLGNMVSMAAASLFLPFLPLLAGQILLNNFLSDIPAIGLASDQVDEELVDRPKRWDMGFIRRFMIEFGLLSSLFDFMTFGCLLWIFSAQAELFRTAWFVESLFTELVIALVVRTRRPIHRSSPGTVLKISTIALLILAMIIPYIKLSSLLGFIPIPLNVMAIVLGITGLYVASAEALKSHFYRNADAGDIRHQ